MGQLDEENWKSELDAFENSFVFNNENDEVKSRRESNGSSTNFPVTLAWQDLSVYVPVKSSAFDRHRPFKRLLHNVSGIVYPGSLVAIMGASGAGKTTLLNVLAYRAKKDVAMTGQILINGVETGSFMSKMSAYVYQEDLFVCSLTVSEHLHFMAKLKMDRRLQYYERQRRVEELLVELSLKRCEHTRIGIAGSGVGISGGERKRLAFASEILTDPQILFCDEPTTGLDSFSAQRLVGNMREMSAKGKTILCSIHQPSSRVFSMFDQLCLLAEGRMAFMGGQEEALTFFRDLGYGCPEHYNPADFFIRSTARRIGDEYESHNRIQAICNQFAVSDLSRTIENNLGVEARRLEIADYEALGGLTQRRRPFWISKTFLLTRRALIDSYRNPQIHLFRTLQKILLSILVGLCFVGLKLDQEGIQGMAGVLYVMMNENTFPALYAVLNVFPREFPLFLREHKAGLYSVDSYYLGKVISLIPGFVFEPALFTAITYWIVGLRPTVSALLFTISVSVLTANAGSALGCVASTISDNVTIAGSLIGPISFIFMVLGGFYVNLSSISPWTSWLQYISTFRYTYEGFNIAQWNGITNISCSTSPTDPCLDSGQKILESNNFDPSDLTFDIFGLILLFFSFHLIAYIFLLRKSRTN